MKLLSTTLATLMLTLFSVTSFGATITVIDPNSDFNVTYDTNEAGLFGTLFLSFNTIFFVPDAFIAESNYATSGAFAVTETLNLTLTATTAGFSFDTLSLAEEGDYVVDGAGAEVYAYGEMRVRSTSSASAGIVDGFSFSDTGDQGPGNQQWSGSATIDAADGWMGDDSSIILTLQNNLYANSGFEERGFIQKKFEGIEITVNPVPVPAAVWLFGSAMISLFGYRKSKT